MKRALFPLAALACVAAAPIPSTPNLGVAEGRCRPGEPGPAFLVTATGLKDRRGRLKLELYPSNDGDFLADDNLLISAGKPFRRVELDVAGGTQLCIRAPAPGTWSLILLHDRDANRKFGLSVDGVGFPGNPKLRAAKPKAAVARATTGGGVTALAIRMNYRRGLLSFGPVGS